MANLLKTGFSGLRNLFTAGQSAGDAWIDTATAALTPREALIGRVARACQWSALLNAVVALALLLILIVVPTSSGALGGVLLGSYAGPPENAMLLVMIGVTANVTALLLLAVAALAQESWTLPFLAAAAVINIAALLFLGFLPAVIALLPLAYILRLILQDVGAWHANPVSVKELRGRMRGVRAFAIITIFLVLMSTFTVLLYLLQLPSVTGGRTIITGELGRLLFIGVVGIELVLVVFIVPALTAGAISGEREHKTYDLLQTTLLSAPMFLVGKMESALGYILLLLATAIPLQSIAFLFGGVSETEVIIAFIILLVTGLLLGALGLFFSAQTERTLTATVRVYTVAMGLCFGLPLIALLLFQNAFGKAISGLPPLPDASPLVESIVIYADMLLAAINPITAAFYTQQMLIDHQELAILTVQRASDGASIPVIAPWLLTTLLYLLATAFMILLAVRRMRRNAS